MLGTRGAFCFCPAIHQAHSSPSLLSPLSAVPPLPAVDAVAACRHQGASQPHHGQNRVWPQVSGRQKGLFSSTITGVREGAARDM